MAGAEEIAPGVRRLTCPNPGPMTHTGTQTYLLGRGELAAIDPGPEHEGHLEALLAALSAGERMATILVPPSHRDHSPGARWLAARTGAPVLAFGPHGAGMSQTMRRLAATCALGGGEGADAGFAPDRCLSDGERFEVGAETVEALHTPGHLSNHLCFAVPARGIVFSGDTVMGWASTLVSPPDGDMGAFMASLHRLAARRDRLYLPGHGEAINDPAARLTELISHREARADQVRAALDRGPGTPAELTAMVYTDVTPNLRAAAERNLLATLIWLTERGEAAVEGPPGPGARFRAA